jgi:P4 family phage/plasmid primase-like protien
MSETLPRKQLATKPTKYVAPPPLVGCKSVKCENSAGATGYCFDHKPVVIVEPVPMTPIKTEQTISITCGLLASDKNFVKKRVSEVQQFLKEQKVKEWYERTQPTEDEPERQMNRVYVDIDGECPKEMSEADFDALTNAVSDALVKDSTDWSVCESGAWKNQDAEGSVKNKLSWSLVFLKKHGNKATIKYFVKTTVLPHLQKLLKDIIPVVWATAKEKRNKDKPTGRICVDEGVYDGKGRKMRLVGQTKPKENRFKKILRGSFVDTLITYVPEDSEELTTPISVFAVKEEPESVKNTSSSASVAESFGGKTTTTLTNQPPFDPEENDEERMELIETVCLNLGQHRYDHYPDWIRMGWVLFNEGIPLEKYIELSKKSKHFKKGQSEEWITDKWGGFKKTLLSQATLWRWLAEDDWEVYYELSEGRKDFWNVLRTLSHAEVAQFYYNQKPDSYLFHESLKWFESQPTGAWKNYEKHPCGLKGDIWGTLKKIAKEHFSRLMADKDANDEEEAKQFKKKMKALETFGKAVGTSGFVDGVIQYLENFYKDDFLHKKMDENRDLFAFTDGVLDLSALPEVVFRKTEPEDYINLTCGYKRPPPSNPVIKQKVLMTFRSCFETDAEIAENPEGMSDVTRAVLQSLSTCLTGKNKFERFYVWTGKGGNGKGMITELLKRVLGDYFKVLPPEVLTKPKTDNDFKCPALAAARGARLLSATEAEAEDRLQVSIIKQLSGGEDEISARALHKNPIPYIPQFKIFLQTNNIPQMNRADGGIQRRLRIFNFPFQFVANPLDSTHKAIDIELKEKVIKSPEWRDELLWLLIESYADVCAAGRLLEPVSVLEASQEYMDENNPVKTWLNQTYVFNLNKNDRRWWVNSTDLKNQYTMETNHKISPEKFKSYLTLCGCVVEKASHNFGAREYQEDTGAWEEVERKAGRYWVGMRKLSTPAPEK